MLFFSKLKHFRWRHSVLSLSWKLDVNPVDECLQLKFIKAQRINCLQWQHCYNQLPNDSSTEYHFKPKCVNPKIWTHCCQLCKKSFLINKLMRLINQTILADFWLRCLAPWLYLSSIYIMWKVWFLTLIFFPLHLKLHTFLFLVLLLYPVFYFIDLWGMTFFREFSELVVLILLILSVALLSLCHVNPSTSFAH